MTCEFCKEITICSCANFCLAPDGGITAGVDYILTLVDKFGIKYTQEITASVYGTLCVDITGFPDGFFNPYIGSLLVTIQLASAPEDDIQVVYGSLNYECISLKVKECPNSTSDVVISPIQAEGYIDQTPDTGTYGLLGGAVNDVNTLFTTSQGSYVSGQLFVCLNGQLLTQGVDWTETNPLTGTFTFVVPPVTGDVITAIY